MPITTQIDKQMALLLIYSSLQAYNPFDNLPVNPPTGYDFIDSWTGVDYVFSDHPEPYGVVFRSKQAPYTYIFAFRGTDSFWDAVDDVYITTKSFVPHGSKTPLNAYVASGFWDIYTTSDATTDSMQTQLFKLIAKYQSSGKPISQIYVTGHSLGAALSELFTLDLALSPYNKIRTINYNYAGPMVGERNFVILYNSQPQQQNLSTRTLRIQNTYDIVPCLPGNLVVVVYHHVGNSYLVAFYGKGIIHYPDLLARHAAVCYNAVLQCAFSSSNGICVREGIKVIKDTAGDYYVIDSIQPDPYTVCSLTLVEEFADKSAAQANPDQPETTP